MSQHVHHGTSRGVFNVFKNVPPGHGAPLAQMTCAQDPTDGWMSEDLDV